MRARRAYEVKHVRGGVGPALLAAPDRVDHVEIVEIESGEVVLFWDLTPTDARRVVRTIREDLANLEADEFIVAWREADAQLSSG
ncbi:MAG: hypothetical protein QOE65_1191 [Solirubrobacteraceae bacterium]|jgi:hypothetical protein|nr:hypothetical protein [Solirubrobacteraceae bacterium]